MLSYTKFLESLSDYKNEEITMVEYNELIRSRNFVEFLEDQKTKVKNYFKNWKSYIAKPTNGSLSIEPVSYRVWNYTINSWNGNKNPVPHFRTRLNHNATKEDEVYMAGGEITICQMEDSWFLISFFLFDEEYSCFYKCDEIEGLFEILDILKEKLNK